MDKDSASAQQHTEQDVNVEQESEVAEALEAYAEEHETDSEHAVPAANIAAVASAVEGGAVRDQEPAPSGPLGAPSVINRKKANQRTAERNARQQQENKARDARKKSRAKGKDWTANELSKVLQRDGAQGVLIALNKREAVQGVKVLKSAGKWGSLLDALPVGKLGGGASVALNQMVLDDVFGLGDAVRLFEIRFGHKAEDVTGHWNMQNMKVMWRQLSVLPLRDVNLNTSVSTFEAISGGGGFYGSSTDSRAIQIGEANTGEYLEHTVRHEIGHGVHAELAPTVNGWLQNDMKFATADWNDWIVGLGGYPESFVDPSTGERVTVDQGWRDYLKSCVETYTGSVSWSPAKASPDQGLGPREAAAWKAMPGPVRNACTQSKTRWYDNYTRFQQVGDKRYFLNHWYHTPFTMGSTAFNAIAATNDTYSAMSEKEFFANCYAEYFHDPKGATDHSKWGGSLPSNVKTFFKTCIVQRQPYDKFKKNQQASKPAGGGGG